MPRKNASLKVTADTTLDTIVSSVGTAPTITSLASAVAAVTRLDDALTVRSFDATLANKRQVGAWLVDAVKLARADGADAGKVGADGAAVTFANVKHATGNGDASSWSWGERTSSTLSDDLNAWHDATPSRVRSYLTLSDADRMLGKRQLSARNVQDCIAWCHRDANPASTSNRADGASDVNGPRVVVSNDTRVDVAKALKATTDAGGDVMTRPIVVNMPDADGKVRPMQTADVFTPAWLASLSPTELVAGIAALEGERKRRSMAGKAGKVTPSVPAPLTSAAVDAVAPAADVAAIVAAVLAAMAVPTA